MINVIIFSKNRPMQLELLLRSLQLNIPQVDKVFIYYKADEQFQANYDKVHDMYGIYGDWYPEGKDFKQGLMDIYRNFYLPFTAIFVDDDVVINPVKLDDILLMFKDWHQSISLSLGLSCDYCYAQGYKQSLPVHIMQMDGIIQWQWTFHTPKTDWAYPMTFDGGIYDTAWLVEKTHELNFDSPNMYAGMLDVYKNWSKPYQLAFKQQKVFNVAANLVQTVCNNRHGEKYAYSTEDLNEKFSEGWQISMKNLQGQVFNSPNGEVEYIFEGR